MKTFLIISGMFPGDADPDYWQAIKVVALGSFGAFVVMRCDIYSSMKLTCCRQPLETNLLGKQQLPKSCGNHNQKEGRDGGIESFFMCSIMQQPEARFLDSSHLSVQSSVSQRSSLT